VGGRGGEGGGDVDVEKYQKVGELEGGRKVLFI